MTDEVKDGGAAFPNSGSSDGSLYPELGMSLRDWFAGQAIGAIMESDGFQYMHGENIKRHVSLAYHYADALLSARKEQSND